MVIRIVKLTMREADAEKFKNYFPSVSKIIRSQEGCNSLQAWQDIHHPNIFFTYSIWNSEDDLNNYRDSAFFLEFWRTVKPWFDAKAEVWTFNKIEDLP